MMDSEIKPLTKEFYDRAVELQTEKITLHFSGGNDEGYLTVHVHSKHPHLELRTSKFAEDVEKCDKICSKISSLEMDIESWAWDVYEYGGAGDGSDYGDDITYDFVSGTVSCVEWYSEPQYSDPLKAPIPVWADEEPEEESEEETVCLTQLGRVIVLISDFKQLQKRYSNTGAGDTEPNAIFRGMLAKLFIGEDFDIPETYAEWELYTPDDETPSALVSTAMTDKMREIAEGFEKLTVKEAKQLKQELCY